MLRKEEILERTSNGLAIFKHYLPGNWRIGRNFLNPLYEDSKASCNIYFDRRSSIYKMKDLFPAEKAAKLSAKNLELIEEIADRTAFIKEHVDAMIEARKVANKIESEREKAIAYHDNIVPMMEEIRYHIDKLELIVDNQMWTLPKYRELLFIR
mgnify:CR=1 FL=1